VASSSCLWALEHSSTPTKGTLVSAAVLLRVSDIMEHYGYIVLCYVLGSVLAASFAGFAFAYGWWWTKRRSHNRNTEDFITARATQSFWRIGWSFYAGAVGSWVIVTPSQVLQFAREGGGRSQQHTHTALLAL
jgi:hypothetical protein